MMNKVDKINVFEKIAAYSQNKRRQNSGDRDEVQSDEDVIKRKDNKVFQVERTESKTYLNAAKIMNRRNSGSGSAVPEQLRVSGH